MRKILVPIDFSKYSNNALDFAYELAKKSEAEIIIMHVIEPLDSQSFSTSGTWDINSQTNVYMDQLLKATTARIEDLASDPKYSEVKVTPHVHIADPGEKLAKVIAKHDVTSIVMGTLGSSGLDELFIGSNTEKVVRYAKCPVIAVPEEASFTNINNLVYATTLSKNDDAVMQRLKVGLQYFDAHLHLLWVNTLHVKENEDEMTKKLEAFAQKHELSNYSVHVTKGVFPEAGILNYAAGAQADAIALATGKKKGIAYLFSGSLAEDVVNHSVLPVWTFNPENLKDS